MNLKKKYKKRNAWQEITDTKRDGAEEKQRLSSSLN